jgi:histidine kinase/DNA gyrase B/HSP90-like ATPase
LEVKYNGGFKITMTEQQYGFGSLLFEDDYLVRTLGDVAHKADVALTELVANAWDAGASIVDIIIPDSRDELLIVKDDGTGLTTEQFYSRWMKLGYNRVKHQGRKVHFPQGRNGNRLAYGRNGIGRHGLLCFNNEYTVITSSEGACSNFVITTKNESQPFVLKSQKEEPATDHGTRLEVVVSKNLPDPERILQVISARFLHDPEFRITINGNTVPLEEHVGLINTCDITIDGVKLKLHFLDSRKAARSTIYQGIAFWQAGRLVGEPSWTLGRDAVIDGRTRFAKQYTGVVKTDDLADYVKEDWTGFKNDPLIDKIYSAVSDYVLEQFAEIARTNLDDTKRQLKEEFHESVSSLSVLGQYEVNEAIENIILRHPTARPESTSIAIETVIEIEKTRSGRELIQKLSQMDEEDIEGLNLLLDQWSVKDALCVLDEIDKRISVIEAIRKLSSDKTVDELSVLHPLVTDARWLFGPEYDSPEYTSNRQLQTVAKILFKKQLKTDDFVNHKKRPDIVILPESTISLTGIESFDSDTEMATLTKVLIVELKKGASRLGREERNQAQGYVEDLIGCGAVIGNPYIHAFVVGEKHAEKLQPTCKIQNADEVEQGQVRIATYAQLVDTAERRLFRLRNKLNDRYDGVSGVELVKKATQEILF